MAKAQALALDLRAVGLPGILKSFSQGEQASCDGPRGEGGQLVGTGKEGVASALSSLGRRKAEPTRAVSAKKLWETRRCKVRHDDFFKIPCACVFATINSVLRHSVQ